MGVLCKWVKLLTVNCIKCVWRPGSARNHWGRYSTPPDLVAVIRRRGGKEGEGNGWDWDRKERERREGVGRDGKGGESGRGERVGKGEETHTQTHPHAHTHTHTRLTALFPGLPG